ncbi:MAG: TIGR04282 family arsenosugar biosynthesis glycosyltransferase [Balneolaceae bacterium]
MKKKSCCLVFVKNPEPGHVKTRLAQSIGDEQAFAVYMKLLRYTKDVVLEADAEIQVWYSKFEDRDDLWPNSKVEKQVQAGEDLGVRMKNAFARAFDEGFEKVVIIGSDCPELRTSHLQQAYDALDRYDGVVGPSEDGGYYLLGLRHRTDDLFHDVDWSTESVLQQTLDTFHHLGLAVHRLENLNDIDTIEDLEASSLNVL